MSRETIQHLNTNTLIGHTDARGTAWHYRAEEQGEESNHYSGAVPVGDVERRLFNWVAESRRLAVEVSADVATMSHLDVDGQPMRWAEIADKQAIARSDAADGTVMGIFAAGYTRHQYREWLLTTVADILDDDLSISSAGLLRAGAVAWEEVSVPEIHHHTAGVRLPSQPAGDDVVRRVDCHHVQAHRHRHGVRQHLRPGPVRDRAALQGQALAVLQGQARARA